MTSLLDEGTRNLTSKQFKNEMKMNGMKLSFSTQKDKIDGVFQIISHFRPRMVLILFTKL